MNRFRSTQLPPALLLLLGILILPLLTTFIGERLPNWPDRAPSSTAFVVDLTRVTYDQRGMPKSVEGAAPADAELAVYLNDELLDIVRADAHGHFSTGLYELPQRRNRLVALPTEVDPSTLTVFYVARGFQERWIPNRASEPEPPFLASATVHDDALQVYGSTEPNSDVEICLGACVEGHPILVARSDDEGSFQGKSPFTDADLETSPQLFGRIRYEENQDWTEFAAPLQPAIVESEQTADSSPVFGRAISLTFSPTNVQLVFDVQMPTGYKIYQNLVRGDVSELEFVEYIFGEVLLNTYLDPRHLAWRQEKQEGSQRVRVLIESDPLPFLIPDDAATTFQLNTTRLLKEGIPLYNAQDQIEVVLKDTRLVESNLLPTESKEDQLIWVGALTEEDQILTLWVSRSPQSDADPINRFKLRDTLSDLLEDVFPKLTRYPLRETLEGEIVGLLPDRVPNPVRAQVYDFYRALYLSDPLVPGKAETDTFHTFLRDVPGRVPDSIENILYGGLWLIPSVLILWAVQNQKDQRDLPDHERGGLALIGWGAAILVVLSLDWLPLLERGRLTRDDYITWVVAAYTMFLLLLSPLRPRITLPTRRSSTLALILVTALSISLTWGLAALLPALPDAGVSILLTALSLLCLASLAWSATQLGTEEHKRPSVTVLLLTVVIIFSLSIPVQALPLRAQLRRSLGVFTTALALSRPLLPVALLLGLAMTLRRRFDEPIGTTLNLLERNLGRVLFVAFAVGLSPSWSFIPVSAILGMIFSKWIIPRDPLAPSENLERFVQTHRAEAIRELLNLNRKRRLWRATERSLQKQITDGKLKPEDYEKHLEEREEKPRTDYLEDGHIYELEGKPEKGLFHRFLAAIWRIFWRKTAKKTPESSKMAVPPQDLHAPPEDSSQKLPSRDLALRFGPGPRRWDNARQALAWGVLLLVPLLLLHGCPLVLSEVESVLPFPFLDIGVRLGVFAIQYLAMAVFLGYFFPYLRGRSGLEKGGVVAGFVILSLLPAHLLMADSIADLPALLVWAGTVLAYNLLIGLIAFDLKTLSDYGYGWDRLTDLYNLREMVMYLTGSGVPFVTTVFSAVAGGLDELVPNILKVVFPSLTLSAAPSELLQALLDLVERIAGAR